MSVQGIESADIWGDDRPGAFGFNPDALTGSCSLVYRCPCGCGDLRTIPIVYGPCPGTGHGPWGWNGDTTKPTTTPSIRHVDNCRFHGFLTAGVWQFCADSGKA